MYGEFFAVCQENHTRLKLEKCEFMQESMQYLGPDIGYGWWTPAASKANPLMDDETPRRGSMMYAVSLGLQLQPPQHQELHLRQRNPDRSHQENYYLVLGPSRRTSV